MDKQQTTNIYYPGIDLFKFILAIIIVSIHVQLYRIIGNWYLIIQDYAVPSFFVFSSYLLFSKLRNNLNNKWQILWSFEKRINILYLFWIIALSPFILTMWHKEYLELPLFMAIADFIKQYFLGFQFGASWFFGALIVGTPIVFLLTRLIPDKGVWIIPIIIYLYIHAYPHGSLVQCYTHYIRTPLLSFPNALWWITLGYLLSGEAMHKFTRSLKIHKAGLLLIGSFLCGYFYPKYNYICCIPASIAILSIAQNIKLNKSAEIYRRLRTYSTHFFCLHFTLIFIVKYFFHDQILLVFLLTLLICWLISECIIWLMSKPYFNWLKFSK